MDRKEIKRVLASVIIAEPCGMDWDNMTGDERIRFCNQCSLKVHNLSAMSAGNCIHDIQIDVK
jgi:hypothetical protein